ncbi:MAG TPA: signal peptidase II [Candidatus Limnocylindrales bacterium]|nr:signal peptidase II [Candidatus Limnocylindrales bacterium]
MTAPGPATVDEEIPEGEIVEDAGAGVGADREAPAAAPWRGPSPLRWVAFALVAGTVLVLDQLSKLWLVAQLPAPGDALVVIDTWLNLVHGRNSGALFGLLPQSAAVFAVVTFGVLALIVVYHRRAGRGYLTTLALGLLLGGAIGNLIDRLRFGYVVDWIDMGIGQWRFYTYNVADAAITTAIVLLIGMALLPRAAEWGAS